MRVSTASVPLWMAMTAAAVLSVAVFANTATHAFTYDDRAAVAFNADLRPSTPWLELLQHDFWGSPLRQECVQRPTLDAPT